jgi:hypothetical protein
VKRCEHAETSVWKTPPAPSAKSRRVVLKQRTYTAQGGYLHLSPSVVSKPVWISHVWIVRLHQPTGQPLGAGLYVPGAEARVAIVDLSARHLPTQAMGQGSRWTGPPPDTA